MTQFTTQCGHFYTIGLRPLACGVGVIWEEEGGREKREKKRGTDLTTEGGRGGGWLPLFSLPSPITPATQVIRLHTLYFCLL